MYAASQAAIATDPMAAAAHVTHGHRRDHRLSHITTPTVATMNRPMSIGTIAAA